MKKLLFVLLGIFLASFVVAQTQQPPQQQPGAYPEQQPTAAESKQMSGSKFIGTVDTVDLTGKTITVKMEKTGETRTFTFDDKTKWDAKDKMFKVDNLKSGDHVTIEADAANLATKIKVKEGTPQPQNQ
jgi:hypothetical protein